MTTELNQNSCLDLEAVSALSEALEDEFTDIVVSFILEGADRVSQLRATAQAADWPTVLATAHIFKGASGNVGAMQLSSACEVLEHGLRTNTLQNPGDVIEQIATSFTDTTHAFRQLLKLDNLE